MTRPTRSGRKARHAKAAAPPRINPAAPGQIGGQYRPLTNAECKQIYDTALRLLSDLGMGEVPDRLRDDLVTAGATDKGDRIVLPRTLVEDCIDRAPKTFPLYGRDLDRTIEVGGSRVYFGTGGAAVNTLDRDTGLYRPSTLADLHDFTRLQDALDNVAWFTRCCIAGDMDSEWALDVNTAYALMANTTKPVATAFTLADHVAPLVDLFNLASDGQFDKTPFVKAHISPVISPMRFGEDAVDVTYECLAHNIPVSCITAAQAGATGPATLAGFLAMSLAETLASLTMVNIIKPGHPMVFSNWPLVVDLRTGSFAGGSGETAVLNAASAQLINWLGLPSGVASSMTDAKAIDAQYGTEKALTSLAAALAGGNLIYESSGMTASLLGASFEAFVLDDEMHSLTYRALRGIEVSDDTLGYEATVAAILRDGHFLGDAQTHAAMERDYHYPSLADRDDPRTWAENGALTAYDRAKARVDQILRDHCPRYLSADQDAKIRASFDIRHPACP
ncbi:trimethylamine methyltransferase family protein [Pseudooctadecabacter jejudonensis]|uniref:Trimethylamine methyltransferase (MTTB) n=1 Tax=Pseudooctadecabacter jejudonensis TaxID=1391910 RepID=A0A1Y5T5L6_9RHOB|nr:trimethylamine methyltransferase family protein [Pseudooctadecabacter jejudonensis]SLN56476.1 Trimethylamine methyltransferase (MTTB) [Pseudooctadecabacter jejudonensis]